MSVSITIQHIEHLDVPLADVVLTWNESMEMIAKREYPHNVERVFDVLLNILDKHYTIKNVDKSIRCVEVSSGASLFSFGETFEITAVGQNTGSAVRIRAKPEFYGTLRVV